MMRFTYARPADVADAVRRGSVAKTRFLAGGTNLVDLLKENVERPEHVVDIGRLPLAGIDEIDGGGLRLGALATNSQTAHDPRVATRYPLLASAILAGASPQLRNAATNGPVATVEGASHWLHIERPEAVNAAVRGFLAAAHRMSD